MQGLKPIRFVNFKGFAYRSAARLYGDTPLLPLPTVQNYDPHTEERLTPSYVMEREEERQRFFELNYAKKQYNLALKSPRPRAKNVQHWRTRYRHLQEYICRLNMPLVYSQVLRSRAIYRNLDWDEAISEGGMALIKAIAGNDTSRETKFSTYAVTIILRALTSANVKRGKKLQRIQTVELPESYGEEEQDLAATQDGSAEDVEGLLQCLRENKARLSKMERLVIGARFGLGDTEQVTLQKIADGWGISKERVRQIQVSALEKLRQALL